ncbi:MAG: transposase [Elusimicrobiota bacterium]
MSEAKWNEEKLNTYRIQILESNRTTKTCPKGVLVIDDTGCKKWGFKTEGAQVQHYGTEDIITNCNIVVASAYCDNKKSFPVNLKPYIPKDDPLFERTFEDFKSKIELAEELVEDAIDKELNFSDIVVDTWYFSNDFVAFIQEKGRTFITEAPVDRLISYRGKWTRADELVKLIPSDKLRWVTVSTPHGKKKGFYTYRFKSKLKGLKRNFLVVLAVGNWNKDDPKDVHIYVTNYLSYSYSVFSLILIISF